MKKVTTALLLLSVPAIVGAQQHEIGLTLGRIHGPSRTSSNGTALELSGGTALQANYGYALLSTRRMSLFGEVHFLANGLREVSSSLTSATRDVATLFVTPGVRVKLAPIRGISPYGVIGGGYALYEQSFFQIDGSGNTAARFTHRGAFTFGGGVDFPLWRWLGGRLEVRDFYTGNPSLNAALRGGQHNVVAGGGVVLRFGGKE